MQHFSINPKTQQRGIITLTPLLQARNKKKCRLEGPRQINPPIVDNEDRLLSGRPAALMELIKYTDAHLQGDVKSRCSAADRKNDTVAELFFGKRRKNAISGSVCLFLSEMYYRNIT